MATNSSTAEVHLFERLMQTQGGGDGSSTSPTVNGADAEERYWTSPPVKYESVCMRAYVCAWVCTCVCVYMCTFVFVHTRVHVCVCVCTCVRVHVCVSIGIASRAVWMIGGQTDG